MARLVQLIRGSFKWKLTVLMLLGNLIVVGLFGLLVYERSVDEIEDNINLLSEKVVTQANSGLNQYLSGYVQSLLLLSSSSLLKEWLMIPPGDYTSHFILNRKIEKEYGNVFFFHYPEINSILLEQVDGNHLLYANGRYISDRKLFDPDNLNERHTTPYGISYYSRAIDYYSNAEEETEQHVIQIINRLRWNGQEVIITMDLDMTLILNVLRTMELGEQGSGMIVDEDYRIIAHPDYQQIGKLISDNMRLGMESEQGAFKSKDSNYYVMYASLEDLPWKTVVVVPFHEFAPFFSNFTKIIISISVVTVLVSIVLSNGFATTFTQRIHALRKAIGLTEKGRWENRIKLKGRDEIYLLGESYNRMLDHLDQTVKDLAETKVKEKQAMMSALQSQIDSHFLYNTLETIHSKAHIAGQTEIEQTVECLSEMLRYSSGFDDTLVSIEDELQHLRNYADIIKIRFGDKFHYRIDLDRELYDFLCLKALLQPIAENSIKHGNVASLSLEVSIRRIQGNYVAIDVMDNGRGFQPDALRELSRRLQSVPTRTGDYKRVGLLNVQARLRMQYGNDGQTGVHVFNRDAGAGAHVRIVFPLMRREDEDNGKSSEN